MKSHWLTGLSLLVFVAGTEVCLRAQDSTDVYLRSIIDELSEMRAENMTLKQHLVEISVGLAKIREDVQILTSVVSDTLPSGAISMSVVHSSADQGPGDKAPETSFPTTLDISRDPVLGKISAPLVIVEFSDFECPFCGRYYLETFPAILAEYVETGRARYIFKQYPLSFHPQGFLASKAALCADDQDRFWQMHHMLFTNQSHLLESDLLSYARSINLNVQAFSTCLLGMRHDTTIRQDMTSGRSVGISGTPHFALGLAGENKGTAIVISTVSGSKGINEFHDAINSIEMSMRD